MADGSFLGGPGLGGIGGNPAPQQYTAAPQFSEAPRSEAFDPGAALQNCRHAYPLAVRDANLSVCLGLLMQSMPYALMRFAVLFGFSIAGIIWMIVTFGGAAFLSTHVAGIFGLVWLIGLCAGTGWIWTSVLRYVLFLIECGHVAVLTELITRGAIGNGSESMFAYGRRIVTTRFGQVNALLGMHLLVRGVLNAFHNTLDWIGEVLPIPGLESISNLVNMVLRSATRYMDKVIFSYNLARQDEDQWASAREGIVYYCQNAAPILKTSIWIIILEKVLSACLWLVFLTPAALVTMMLPHAMRESGAIVTIVIAILFAANVRAAFLKPLFMIMIMVRYHALVENQPINQDWVGHLEGLSDKFRDFGQQAAVAAGAAGAAFRR